MDLLLILSIISLICSVVLVIMFIDLCSSAKFLARRHGRGSDFSKDFALYLAIGLNDRALDVLLEYIKNDTQYEASLGTPAYSVTQSARKEMHNQYDKYFEALGITLDFDKIDQVMYSK